MVNFDKNEIREKISLEDIFSLLVDWGGEPEYTSFGIISQTICHNPPGEGSRKLYYYENSGLFKCYTGCDATFDIFELAIKISELNSSSPLDLNSAIRLIAFKCGISGTSINIEESIISDDKKILDRYDRIQSVENKDYHIVLKEYDRCILDRFNYSAKILPWLQENISQEVMKESQIGFYPGGNQITIPHFDINNRFIGLRGRSLCEDDCDRFGKYRPLFINQQFYSHPLGMNLYNLNNSKENISRIKKAIIFESEKSTLKYKSYFGKENDISVACCGSSISIYQIQLLLDCGAQEIIIAFDRQFQEIGDSEFIHLKRNLLKINQKYKNYALISFIFDKNMLTNYKDAPIDDGIDIFLQLYKERIIL